MHVFDFNNSIILIAGWNAALADLEDLGHKVGIGIFQVLFQEISSIVIPSSFVSAGAVSFAPFNTSNSANDNIDSLEYFIKLVTSKTKAIESLFGSIVNFTR